MTYRPNWFLGEKGKQALFLGLIKTVSFTDVLSTVMYSDVQSSFFDLAQIWEPIPHQVKV